jgi:hypothetical protein
MVIEISSRASSAPLDERPRAEIAKMPSAWNAYSICHAPPLASPIIVSSAKSCTRAIPDEVPEKRTVATHSASTISLRGNLDVSPGCVRSIDGGPASTPASSAPMTCTLPGGVGSALEARSTPRHPIVESTIATSAKRAIGLLVVRVRPDVQAHPWYDSPSLPAPVAQLDRAAAS